MKLLEKRTAAFNHSVLMLPIRVHVIRLFYKVQTLTCASSSTLSGKITMRAVLLEKFETVRNKGHH